MNLFLVGVLFVFAKTNLQLLDTGVFFYSTNAIGYLLICLGIGQLADQLPGVQKLLPAAVIMVLHSLGFALLNGSGHSIQTIPLTSGAATAAALVLAALAIGGMGMIFYFLHEVLLAIRNEETAAFPDLGHLELMPGLLLVLLILTTILLFTVPAAASVLMFVLLVGEVVLAVQISVKTRAVL